MEPPEIDKQGRLVQIKVDVALAGASLSMIKAVKTLKVQETGTDKWRGRGAYTTGVIYKYSFDREKGIVQADSGCFIVRTFEAYLPTAG